MSSDRVKCSFTDCNQTFSRRSDRTRHENEVHGDMKACPVEGCNWRNAKRKGRLETHMKKEHRELYNVSLEVPDQWHQQSTTSSCGFGQTGYNSTYGAPSTAAAYNSTYDTTSQQPQEAETAYYDQDPNYYASSSSQADPYYTGSTSGSGNTNIGATAEATYSAGSYTTVDGQVVYNTTGTSPTEHYSSNYWRSSSG